MPRPAKPGDRPHRSAPVAVLPSALVAAACVAARPGGALGGTASRLLAPNLRGHVSSRTLAGLASRGLTVHRVGSAAYVHGQGVHWIFGVWDRGGPVPPFASRLGRASEGYRRRVDRLARETRHRELARVSGRFAGRLPWHRVRPVRAYTWESERPSWLELVASRAEARNRAARVALGLEWADNRRGDWYPAASGALEARGMDGDR